jgi:exonuclease VII large subunit
MPTSLASLRQAISDKFMFSPSDAAEVVISYVKDLGKKIIQTEQDFSNFISNKIGKISLDISQDSRLYLENYNTLKKESDENKKTLEECLKRDEELKKKREELMNGEMEKINQIEQKIQKLQARKKKLEKKNETPDKSHRKRTKRKYQKNPKFAKKIRNDYPPIPISKKNSCQKC